MSSDGPTTGTTNPRRRILWLVVGHVVVGLIGAFVAYFPGPDLVRRAAFVGIVASQTSLLGIWVGFGSDPWWKTLIGIVLGVGYLGILLGTGRSGLAPESFVIVALDTTFVAMPLLIARFFRVAVRLDCSPAGSLGRIQFTIRHLMILTFVVACLTTVGKWVQPYLPHGGVRFELLLGTVMFGSVGVLPVWFVLATKQPVLYSVGLVAVGAGAGYCLAKISRAGNEGIWMTAAASEAMAVVASLLVVRSCGYRLVRLPPRRQGER